MTKKTRKLLSDGLTRELKANYELVSIRTFNDKLLIKYRLKKQGTRDAV